jgi:hypothetical protein
MTQTPQPPELDLPRLADPGGNNFFSWVDRQAGGEILVKRRPPPPVAMIIKAG